MWAVALRTVPRPRARRRLRPGRLHRRLPPRRLLPRRGRRHDLAAPHRRQRLPRPAAPAPADDASCPSTSLADRHDHHASTEVRLDIQEALARLPEGQRAALVLVDMHAVPVAEAAVILGVAEGTIKSRCARGRAALAAAPRPDARACARSSRTDRCTSPARGRRVRPPREQWLNPGEPDGHRGPSNPRRPAHPCLPVRPLHALPEGPHRWTSPRTPLSPTDPSPSPTDVT